MNLPFLIGAGVLAVMQGLLVALPRPDALAVLVRLRARAWAALLPAIILFGTLVPLAIPSSGLVLVVIAAVAAPLLIVAALIGVVRGPRVLAWLGAAGLVALAAGAAGWQAQLGDSFVTALEALCVGVAIARLIPGRALLAGVVAMCAVDVSLIVAGVAQPAGAALSAAASRFHGPLFDQATVGSVTIGFPDLTLAALVGAQLAEDPARQRRTAVGLTVIVCAYSMLLPFVTLVPATVPIALAYVVFGMRRPWRVRRPRSPSRPGGGGRGSTATTSPGTAARRQARLARAPAG